MTATVEQARRAATGNQSRAATAPLSERDAVAHRPDPWVTPVECVVCGRLGLPRLGHYPQFVEHPISRHGRPRRCPLPPRDPHRPGAAR